MKCRECGAEFAIDTVICPKCGAEVQIVPDFNIYEDEMFQTVKEDEIREENERREQLKKEQEEIARANRKKTVIIAVIIAMVCLIFGIVVGVLVSNQNKNKNSYDYQMQQANEAYSTKNYDSAIGYLQKALSLNGNSLDARFLLSQIYRDQGDTDSALDILNEIFIVDPANKDALVQILNIYDEMGDYDSIYEMAKENTESAFKDVYKDYIVPTAESSVPGGSYDGEVHLTFLYRTDLNLYYTLDGTAPKPETAIYYTGGEILLREYTVVRAVCYDSEGRYSAPLEEIYDITYSGDITPIIEPESGTYTETMLVSIMVPEGGVAYYTTDGTQPTAMSAMFTEPFEMPEGNNVLSVIVIRGNQISDVVTRMYTYTPFDQE